VLIRGCTVDITLMAPSMALAAARTYHSRHHFMIMIMIITHYGIFNKMTCTSLA